MTTHHFLTHLEHERIHAAIKRAEKGTSGDIVVFITHKKAPDALAAAQEVFQRRHHKGLAKDNSQPRADCAGRSPTPPAPPSPEVRHGQDPADFSLAAQPHLRGRRRPGAA